ncbi:MAG: hypothetical protein ACE5HP_04325 [Gemmatimonadota bacterium]
MSLIGFHRVLIGTAILFCLGFGAWAGAAFLDAGATLDLVLAILFGLAAVSLSYYLLRLDRFLGREAG